MSTSALKFISDEMQSIGIDYELAEWTSDSIPYVYWVGEYTESESETEDGLQETTFLLTGTSKTWFALEQAKESIENNFSKTYGKTAILSNGNGIAVYYADALMIPTGDATFKRMQINLKIKEWSI